MKKLLVICLSISVCLTAPAQTNLSLGSPREFKLEKAHKLAAAVSAGDKDYFVFKSGSISNESYTLISLDKDGNVKNVDDILFDPGRSGNGNYMHSIKALGNKLLLLFENRDKDAGQNTMVIRSIKSDATVNKDDVKAGSFEFTKMMKPGDWYAEVTPDKKHLALVGKLPADKEDPSDKLKLFLLDENLKVIAKNDITLPEGKKKIAFNSKIYASDKGDFYLIENAFDNTYRYPIIYQASVSSPKVTITPLQLEDGSIKNMSFTAAVSPAGDLVVAGYYQRKSGFNVGAIDAFGSWLFNSAKPAEIKTFKFDKPISGMDARGIVFNGNTMFLIGEQYDAKRLTPTSQQMANFEESYDYTHKDILVSAFDENAEKKFELRINNNWKAVDLDQALYPAYGIVNDKVAVIYNDQYNKYFTDRKYTNDKLPVLVNITNDGLMEAPVTFEKELDPDKIGYTLYPKFINGDGKSKIVLLAGDRENVRGVVFK